MILEWLVMLGFVVGIFAAVCVAIGFFLFAWILAMERREYEGEQMKYAEEDPTYPWGLHQSD
jgi:hypothetical protein